MKKLTPAGKRAFKFLGIFFFITMAISGVFFYQFIKGEGMRIGSDVPRIDHSDYYNIEGKIYVTPWSSIPSRIKDADAASFRVLKNSPWGRASVGVDKNRVYCGEFALDGLDPARVKIVSPQYYSDGQTSYFCSYNPALYDAMWKYMFKLFFSAFGFTDYPQSYYFPFARLDTNVSISPLTQNPNVATDGKFAFYKGKILHGADIANLRNIKEKEFYLDNFVLKHGSGDSKEILTDGKSVFWDAEIIDFITSDQIYLLKVNFGKEFLYEPARGAIYTQKERLDPTNEPYAVLNPYVTDEPYARNNIYALLTSPKGIFYISKNKTLNNPASNSDFINYFAEIYYALNDKGLSALKKASDNPFKGEVRQIANRVFKDERSFYYLDFRTHEDYVYGRGGKRISNKTNFIELHRLVNLDVHDEKVIAQIAGNLVTIPGKSELLFSARDVEINSHVGFFIAALLFVIFIITSVGSWIGARLHERRLRKAIEQREMQNFTDRSRAE